MKVVIDTSVWISALISGSGEAKKVIRYALELKISPQLSSALFLEYEEVMNREDIINKCKVSKEEQSELFYAYLSVCNYNEIYYLLRPNLKDENDNFIVELAVASNSEYIITYNTKDFKDSDLKFNTKIITPTEFLKEIKL